jgi:hypothetical protein
MTDPIVHFPNDPITMEEAAERLFHVDYRTLKANIRTLIAQGMPVHREGRRYLLYPAQIEAWRISRLNPDAKRALRQGGYECSDANAKANLSGRTTSVTP